MAAYKDYYNVLGIPKTATQKDIKAAFRKLAAKYHPDRNPDDASAEETFKEINEAYTVLNDPEKRKFYDQYGTTDGRPPFANAGGAGQYSNVNPEDLGDFSDFFQSLFGGGGFSFRTGSASSQDPFRSYQQRPSPQNAEATLEISLTEAYKGGNTAITINGKHIDVNIPKGIKDGAKLRLRGQAPSGGDLYLRIKHKKHPVFTLNNDNIRVIIDVPDYRAVLGGPVRVPTLDGDVEMTLPKGTQAGKTLRLRGQGWIKKDGSRGDELAEIRITIPTNASKEQLELYEKLAALSSRSVSEAAD